MGTGCEVDAHCGVVTLSSLKFTTNYVRFFTTGASVREVGLCRHAGTRGGSVLEALPSSHNQEKLMCIVQDMGSSA